MANGAGRRENRTVQWRSRRINRIQMIMLGFLIIILVGTLLLMLPWATRAGAETTFSGALFTSVSATCVTGLVVYDTWMHWTLFGQLVLLTEIQIGGLGFITIGTFAMLMLRKKIGLEGRELIRESLSTLQLRGSVRLVRRIVCGSALLEGAGALLLAIRFVPQMGFWRGVYYGIFHAVSAFCNAGFDLMGWQGAYSSFTGYVSDPLVSIVLMVLIIVGGIGFLIWEDLLEHRWHWRRYRLQTKIVLSITGILLAAGTLLFLVTERDGLFAGMGPGQRILAAAFSAVTPRTAGFNTVDTALLSEGGKLVTILLMFIGGSPGSTAGGIKTTTVVVIFLHIKAYLFHTEDCVIFHRRLNRDAISRASVVVFINLVLVLLAVLVIEIGQALPLTDVLFEAFSAVGTSGMSTGITRDLNLVSQIAVALLMFFGRVGSVTFAMSFTERKHKNDFRYPEDEVIVG